MKLRTLLFLLFSLLSITATIAQETNVWNKKPDLKFGGFIDVFYAYDFNKPETDYRQPFFYNHNRHNEFNVNLALLQLNVLHEKYRANIGLQVGSYAIDNYAQEPEMLKHIYEAYIGLSLNSKNSLWLDAGVFASHIGFESAISIDNKTLTRSISVAENIPYYLTGAKVTYDPSEHWTFAAMIINGWQRIRRLPGNSTPSFGTQVNFHPSDKLTLNWSTFVGTDDPDSIRRIRIVNDFYGLFSLTERISLIAGIDIGIQQQSKNSTAYNNWITPVMIVHYKLNKHWSTAFRAEYFNDKQEVIVSTHNSMGFQTAGFSGNLDYFPSPNIACRLEARWLTSHNPTFKREDGFVQDNFFIVGSVALRFEK